jgi:hypothetical protein
MHFDGRGDNGDAYRNNVVFNLRMEGVDGTAVFTEDTGKALTVNGTSKIAAGNGKYGAGGTFSGNGNYIAAAANAAFDPGSSDFTMEAWVYPVSNGTVLALGNGASYGNSLWIEYSSSKFGMGMASNGTSNAIGTTYSAASYPTGQWYHVAVTRSSGSVTLWVGGQSAATATYAGPGKTGNRLIVNGLYDNNGLGNGGGSFYIDDVRWTRDVARYSSTFTPGQILTSTATPSFVDEKGASTTV